MRKAAEDFISWTDLVDVRILKFVRRCVFDAGSQLTSRAVLKIVHPPSQGDDTQSVEYNLRAVRNFGTISYAGRSSTERVFVY